MKRAALLRHLRKHGCMMLREGGRHSWWHNHGGTILAGTGARRFRATVRSTTTSSASSAMTLACRRSRRVTSAHREGTWSGGDRWPRSLNDGEGRGMVAAGRG